MLEVLELRNICSFPADVSDNRPAAHLVDALKYGIRVWDGYFFANWQNEKNWCRTLLMVHLT